MQKRAKAESRFSGNESQSKSSLLKEIQRFKSSLHEKEILLKEIHHRAKNNLQIISGLLTLQASHIKDAETRNMFLESQNRIRSIALVHEKLSQSVNLSSINLKEYISSLVPMLQSSILTDPSLCRFQLQLTDILININLAIPLGMIINELVSNSLKYAFPENRSGEISITLQQSHADGSPSQADTPAFDLIIADNGVGMKETVDIENVKTLGVQLVHMLIRQVGGRIEKLPVSGTAFKISVGVAE